MNTYSKTALAAAITVTLAACSSGSTSNDENTPNNNGENNQPAEVKVERVSLTGLAVKGNVRNAKVELFRVVNDQRETTAFATGSTDANGRYSIQGISDTPYDGPAIIEVSHQTGAKMVCDSSIGCRGTQLPEDDINSNNVIDFAEPFELPQQFIMTAVIPRLNTSALGKQVFTANVTSLTHISAQYAENRGINEATIRNSNNRVRLMFGLDGDVDIVLTEPTDVTSGDTGDNEATRYGTLTAALANIAKDRNQTITEVLATFAQNYIDNKAQLRWNEKSGSDQQIDIEQVLAAAAAIANQVGQNTLGSNLTDESKDANNRLAESVSDFNPPVALPGANQKVETGDQVTLSGAAEIPDGLVVTYKWSQISGSPVELANADSAQASFVAPDTAGELVFAFRVAETGQDNNADVARLRVLVEAKAGQNTHLAGKYTSLSNTIDYSLVNPNITRNEVEFSLAVESSNGLLITAKEGSASDLVITDNSVNRKWKMVQKSTINSTGTKVVHSHNNLASPEIDVSSDAMAANIDSQSTVTLQIPDDTYTKDGYSKVEIEYGRNLKFYPITTDTYAATTVTQRSVFAKAADGSADKSQLHARKLSPETMILSKNPGNVTGNNLASQYGVVSLELATDSVFGQGVSSELQTWTIPNKENSSFSFKRQGDDASSDTQTAPFGRISSLFTAELALKDKSYQPSETPNMVNNKREEKTNDASATPVNIRNSSTLFNQPLINNLVKSGLSAAFQGTVSDNGEFLAAHLMSAGSLGKDSHSNPVTTHALSYNFGIAFDPTIASCNLSGKKFHMQGIEFGVETGSGNVSANTLNGVLSVASNGDIRAVVNDDSMELTLSGDHFDLKREQETYVSDSPDSIKESGKLSLTSCSHGRILIQDDEVVLEGFINATSNLMVMRLFNKQVLTTGPMQPGSGDSKVSHGYLILNEIKDQ